MSAPEREVSSCPICESLLQLDEDGGFFCPYCGWDESADPEEDEVWIVPDRKGDEKSPDK